MTFNECAEYYKNILNGNDLADGHGKIGKFTRKIYQDAYQEGLKGGYQKRLDEKESSNDI